MPNEISRQNKSKNQLKGICENYEFFFANGKPNKFPRHIQAGREDFILGGI